MPERILHVANLSKRFDGFTALDAVSLHVGEGERVGLIGPNGSGKTTMINCISGALPCDSGRVVFKGQDVTRLPAYRRVRLGITRSFQIPRPFRSMSVLENLCVPLAYARHEKGHGRDVRGLHLVDGIHGRPCPAPPVTSLPQKHPAVPLKDLKWIICLRPQ